MPIYYFMDLGLRNFAINQFDNLDKISQTGFLFQNYIANLINSQLNLSSNSFHF